MKKKLASTKCTVILKKSLYSDGWRLILLSYPVFVNGKATRKYESINRIISTPIWEKCSTGSIKKPKRDRNGIIQCTSEIDQSACRYADNFRIARQQEYDKTGLFTDVEKEITEREERGNQDFVEYFKSVIKKNHPGSPQKVLVTWDRVAEILSEYSKGKPIPFKTINIGWLTNIKYYLMDLDRSNKKGKISQNTASHYFAIIKAALRMAFIDDFLQVNIAEKVAGIRNNPGRREALTMDEVNKLIQTPCEYDVIRSASIFSILA